MQEPCSSRQGLGRRIRHALAVCLVLGGLSALTGCAGTAGAGGSAHPDDTTASDQTSADRRAQIHMELAGLYFGRGENNNALDEIKQTLAADPNRVTAHNLRGLIYAALGRNQLAEESFQRALQLNPNDPDTLHNYGWFLCQQKRFDPADARFAAALAQPGYREAQRTLLARGVCQARNRQWDLAEHTLSKAYELAPADPTTAVNLSEVLYRQGQYERARFYIRRVNANNDQISAQTLWLALRIEHRSGQRAAEQELAGQLIRRFPKSPEALLYEKGQFDE